jgi:SAM-dependent methyltransferase
VGRPAASRSRSSSRRGLPWASGDDPELSAGSRAHYDDASYYASTYARRIDDVQYYVDVALKAKGPVLEYGVGNGRIALPVARHGVDVWGIDLSETMLADLRERLLREPVAVRRRVHARCGDMREARLRKRFPLVTCPFNAALHLYTRTDVERFFARVREHLTPDGIFVSDLSVPELENLVRDPARAYHAPRFRHPSAGEVVKYWEHFDYDALRQILFVSMNFEPVSQREQSWMTPLAHRQFFPAEWEALLHYNGFEIVEWFGDFHRGPFKRASDVMVVHARAKRRGR